MNPDVVLWVVFGALLAAALWVARPRPPAWDPARFHQAVLATLLGGEVEAAGGGVPEWKDRLAARLPAGPPAPGGDGTGDPDDLGADYDPVARLGAGCTWDAVAEGAPAVAEAVHRRLDDVRLVWFGPAPTTLPGVRTHHQERVDLAALALPDLAASTRYVLATQAHGAALLAALRDAPGVRDRTRALLFVGATFDPDAPPSQDAFDTELDRTTPWFVLRTEDTPEARLADPPLPETQRRSVQVHDLGRVRPDALGERALATSLATPTAMRP